MSLWSSDDWSRSNITILLPGINKIEYYKIELLFTKFTWNSISEMDINEITKLNNSLILYYKSVIHRITLVMHIYSKTKTKMSTLISKTYTLHFVRTREEYSFRIRISPGSTGLSVSILIKNCLLLTDFHCEIQWINCISILNCTSTVH